MFAEKIDQCYESIIDEPRYHLGCSEVGKKCCRALWYSFRHATTPEFSGRMKRLFRLGHDYEVFFRRDLELIGAKVHSDQKKVDLGCHLSGSIDGMVEFDGDEYLLELKTHSEKSFNYLKSKGVRSAKPQHYIQMQVYMHGLGIDKALYMAVNKNTSELFTDIIKYNKKVAEKHIERAHAIVMTEAPPERLSVDDEMFDCKYCDSLGLCRLRGPHNINCRTCAHSEPKQDSTWMCSLYNRVIPNKHQLESYPCHVIMPGMVTWKCLGGDGKNLKYIIAGVGKINGIDGEKSSDLIKDMQ